jgi:hypothetical protein
MEPVIKTSVGNPFVTFWHEWIFSQYSGVFFPTASETEEAIFTSWLFEGAEVGSVFDHVDSVCAGTSFVVEGRDVEVVGVTFSDGGTELFWDDWFEEFWIVEVESH